MRLDELIRLALAEDIGPGDVTTESCIEPDAWGEGIVIAKAPLVVCGHEPAREVFAQLGASYTALVPEGEMAATGSAVARAEGPMRSLLTGERVALNFMMRLSGIATHTRRTVAKAGTLKVVDTRKTTPLHRALEKHAVTMGGGGNHRFALYDGVLIKDNHIAGAGGVTQAVQAARSNAHHLLAVQVEVETLDQLTEALAAGADAILLDNMDDDTLRDAVTMTAGRATLEASGNMDAERIARIADLGLDRVSMGGLIHQARWVDLSMAIGPAQTPNSVPTFG